MTKGSKHVFDILFLLLHNIIYHQKNYISLRVIKSELELNDSTLSMIFKNKQKLLNDIGISLVRKSGTNEKYLTLRTEQYIEFVKTLKRSDFQ